VLIALFRADGSGNRNGEQESVSNRDDAARKPSITRREILAGGAGLAALMLPGASAAQNLATAVGGAEWRERFDISTPRNPTTRSRTPLTSPRTVETTEWAIGRYREIVANGGWNAVPAGPNLRLGATSPNVPALRRRLIASGDLEQNNGRGDVFDSFVESAVRRFQFRHGIGADGIVRRQTYEALNIPAETRLRQLELNLGRLRNMATNLGDRYVMMNIPAAELEAVQNGVVHTRHTTVVGQIDRQSPILAVRIVEVNFNPFWTVPTSIVRRDLIPRMQRDPEYLTRLRIRIYDRAGNELQPSQVNWNSDEAVQFRFRQDPSDQNSMGSVRIGMHNSENVYMHDTPQKALFGAAARFHSSGCARVQNVRELVTWILAEQPEWGRGRIDQAVRAEERVDVRLRRPIPVYWVYMTAWGTDDGLIQFRNDIYRRDEMHLAGNMSLPATPYDPVGPQALAPGQRGPNRVQ
jgi:murein L,D-transpeptidase YcbB/YkuD